MKRSPTQLLWAVSLSLLAFSGLAMADTESLSLRTASTPQFAGVGIGVASNATGLISQGGVASIGTQTTTYNRPMLNVDQTWNNVNVSNFNLVDANVTQTAGRGNLLSLRSGGITQFEITDDGAIKIAGNAPTISASPNHSFIFAASPWPASGSAAADLYIGGGLGTHYYTILTAANLSGKTFTVTANGSPHVLTDGTDFTHSNTNSVEAQNLAAAISTITGVTGTFFDNGGTEIVGVTAALQSFGTFSLTIATNAAGGDATVTTTADGVLQVVRDATVGDGKNIILGSTTGTKIGTATSQKLGFFNATPVVQQTGSSDVLASLVTLGLRAASSNPPLNIGTGSITCGPINIGEAQNIVLGTTSGSRLANSTSQKLGFWGATPVVQTTGSTDVLAGLVTIGLRASSSNPPLDLGSGALGSGTHTLTDPANIVVGTSSGTKIGTSTSQKLGFFNATPVVQESGSNDILASLVTLGLRAASSNPPLDQGTGTHTCGAVVAPTFGTTSAANVNLQYNSGTSASLIGKPATSAATTTLQTTGLNGGSVAYGVLHTSTTLSTGAATTNLGVNVPAGSVVYATSCRVTTGITTAATFNLEDAGGHFYGATIANTVNSTGVYGGPPATTSGGATLFPAFYSSANTFKLVCNTTPGAGVVETILYYYTITAPTS